MRVTLSFVSLAVAVVLPGATQAAAHPGQGAMEILTPLPASVRVVKPDGSMVPERAFRPRALHR